MMHKCRKHKKCISDAIHKVELICKDKKLRFTDLRRNALEIIWQSHRPAKAYDILDDLKGMGYSAKPPTVYRTLNFLLEHGFIHKLDSLNAYAGCSHPCEHDECYFLICDECQEVKECCDRGLSNLISRTTRQNKFSPQHTTLEIKGTCHECLTRR